jgi:hypothetical protein
LEIPAYYNRLIAVGKEPHPLYPPLLKKERGKVFIKEGLTPLLNTPEMRE